MSEEEKENIEGEAEAPVASDADTAEGAENDAEKAEEKRIVTVEGEQKIVGADTEAEPKSWENEREHFRVFFPAAETPTVTIDDVDYEVVDASEKGLKFKKNEGECPFEADQLVRATFTLRTGDSCQVEGKILRVLDAMVVLLLVRGVPFKLLMSEQRRFVSIYKHVAKD